MVDSEKTAARKQFWRRGEPWVWITGGSASIMLLMIFILLVLIGTKGLATFWPQPLAEVTLGDGSQLLGQQIDAESKRNSQQPKTQFKIGNRDIYGLDFRWVETAAIKSMVFPPDAIALEREEYGDFYGFLRELRLTNITIPPGMTVHKQLASAMAEMDLKKNDLRVIDAKIATINARMKTIEIAERKAAFRKKGAVHEPIVSPEKQSLETEFTVHINHLSELEARLKENAAIVTTVDGSEREIAIKDIVRAHYPNQMSLGSKLGYYGKRVLELFLDDPRESNTEGGLFPAIFGTIMLVFLMAISSFPLGVITGIYLREYAKDGIVVRIVRIAVNNLAGVPSIVYGIFGLGFFIYGIGSSIDKVFFPEWSPEPVFGTGGILWASLTLGILTIPVVIVSVEEALGSIPKSVRESSLALGATKLQTLVKILIPMASPGMMTGFILAMARAAGEVAPLMITGVVKLAPTLPVDGTWPFLHLDRKFMHLGFHIYDISSQSPNVEAAKPMIYVTTLLLILIVLSMSGLAIYLRNRMKKSFTMSAI